MDLPYIQKSNRKPVDVSEVVLKIKDVGSLSETATALLMKINDNIEKTKENPSNAVFLELRKENTILENLVNKLDNETEKEKLLDVLKSLKNTLKSNSSYAEYYTTQFEKSFFTKLKAQFEKEEFSNVFKSLNEYKEQTINNLPPFWKGLVNIGRDIYNVRKERKEKVYQEVQDNYKNLTSQTNENQEISNSEKQDINSIIKKVEGYNLETDIKTTIQNLERVLSETYENIKRDIPTEIISSLTETDDTKKTREIISEEIKTKSLSVSNNRNETEENLISEENNISSYDEIVKNLTYLKDYLTSITKKLEIREENTVDTTVSKNTIIEENKDFDKISSNIQDITSKISSSQENKNVDNLVTKENFSEQEITRSLSTIKDIITSFQETKTINNEQLMDVLNTIKTSISSKETINNKENTNFLENDTNIHKISSLFEKIDSSLSSVENKFSNSFTQKEKFTDITKTNHNEKISSNFTDITENLKNISESKEKKESVSSLEQEETYKRETIKVQNETRDSIEKIYSFLTGTEFSKRIKTKEQTGSVLGNLVDIGKNLLGKKIFSKFEQTKIGSKFASSQIGKIFKNSFLSKTERNTSLVDNLIKGSEKNTKTLLSTTSTDLTKTLGTEATEAVGKNAGKSLGKSALKNASKGIGKSLLKKVPVIGLLASGLFGMQRAFDGDFKGALMELASGAASMVPGLGTGVSAVIDAGLMARDTGAFENTNNSVDYTNKTFDTENFKDITNQNSNNQINEQNSTIEKIKNSTETQNNTISNITKTKTQVPTNKESREYVYTYKDMKNNISKTESSSPTVVNNYNTTNNNISQSKVPPQVQYLINPVSSDTWQGAGWCGAR